MPTIVDKEPDIAYLNRTAHGEDPDTEITKMVETEMSQLQTEMVRSKITQASVIAQSVADGGVGSVQEAIQMQMDLLNIGVRAMARAVGKSRKVTLGMIEGRVDIPAEDLQKMVTVLTNKKPDLFEQFEGKKL